MVIYLIIYWILNPRILKFVSQIITDILPEGLPKRFRSEWLTLSEDGDKEIPELISSLHVNCLSETDVPLSIILQKAMSETGIPVSWEKNAIHRSKSIEGSGTFDPSEEGPEVKAFTSFRRDIKHPANGKSPLSW
jgi:hypothetical protein